MSNLKTQNGLDFILLNKDFKNAYQFANEELKVYLDSIIDSIKNNIKLEHKRYLNIKDEYNKYFKKI